MAQIGTIDTIDTIGKNAKITVHDSTLWHTIIKI